MKSDYSIDYDGFRRLIDFQAENGTNALLITGSCGEVALLSPDERREIMRTLAPYAADKIPTFFGTAANTTRETIELTQFAEEHGAAGVVLTVPGYSLPPQDAVREHLIAVAKSVSIPFGLYNNPSRVGVTVTPETIAAVRSEAPNFTIDKEAVKDPQQISRVLELTGGEVSVLVCDNPGYGLIPTAVTLASGVANLTGNMDPQEMAYVSTPLAAGDDIDEWRSRYMALLPLMRAGYWLTNPVTVKCMLNLMGLPAGPTREPLQPVRGKLLGQLEEIVAHYRLRERYGRAVATV
jgi:4-hydroxy-tetrahydrodipicolinate synthase